MVKAKPKEKEDFRKNWFGTSKTIDAFQKYILPNEGTMDFALMYLPSESVFMSLQI